MGQVPMTNIISLVIAGIGLLVFLTFATYPLDAKIVALFRRIRDKAKERAGGVPCSQGPKARPTEKMLQATKRSPPERR